MEDDVGVRRLVEFIFVNNFQVTAEMTAQDSSFPPCLLTKDFPQKLRCILIIRQAIVSDEWRNGFNDYNSEFQPSSENYLKFVISACIIEHTLENKVFECFLSSCGLVRFFSRKMFEQTGMDFRDLNSDIFMEFYDTVLKQIFLKCGGFQRLVGYIHQHKYLKWNLNVNDLASLDDPSAQVNVHIAEKLEKEMLKEINFRKSGVTRQTGAIKLRTHCDTMVQKVLSTASVKLPTSASSRDPNQKEDAINQNKNSNLPEENLRIKEAPKSKPLELSRCLSLNSDSKTNHETKQKEYTSGYEGIVQAVFIYNRSKGSDLAKWDNQLLKKVNEILDHLKDAIKCLIEVLDEYDEE